MVVERVNISLLRIKIMSMLIVIYSLTFLFKKKKFLLIASFLLVFLTKYCALHCKIVLGILHQNAS